MKFVCDRCQTKYSIADERVRGKVLKVKCKTCANLITVREARRPTTGGLQTIAHAGGGPAPSQAMAAAAQEHNDEWEDSARTILSPYTDLPVESRPPAPPAPPRRPTGPVPPVAPGGASQVDDGLQWYMALEGQRTGPFTRRQLVDKLAPLPRQADVHVWNEKLGAWKPPADVPALAADITARRRPPTIPPGAPRRTPSPPMPAVAGPPPGAPGRRPTTGPIATLGAGASKLPLPSHAPPPKPVDLFAPAAPVRHDDPGALLQTPAPHAAHGPGGTNGVGPSNGAIESLTGRGAVQSSSDVLKLLNLPGAAHPAGPAPAPPARLMTGPEAVGWSPSTGAQSASRTKNARLIFAFLGIIAVVCVVVTLSVKKSKPPTPVAAPKATVTDPLAAVVEKAGQPAPPEVAPTPTGSAPAPAPTATPGRGGRPTRGQHGRTPGQTAPGSFVPGGTAAPAAPAEPPPSDPNARFRDGADRKITGAIANRPPPSQSDISRVISNNRNGIKTCYQRALLRDSSLTHGKVTVTLSIGISGRVKRVVVDGPTQFRAVEPCMREVVSRWAFPQASEEYGTEFVYVFQGNE
jgi:predicted Zn finger-like uncharacterized protein